MNADEAANEGSAVDFGLLAMPFKGRYRSGPACIDRRTDEIAATEPRACPHQKTLDWIADCRGLTRRKVVPSDRKSSAFPCANGLSRRETALAGTERKTQQFSSAFRLLSALP